jgi:1-phosphofructokinase family hexose kinase
MIYTVTLNPSLDRTLRYAQVRIGELNRAKDARIDLSGKGVNVSLALRQFGLESVTMGLVGGVSGRVLVEGLQAQGLACDFVPVNGEIRSNITVIDESTGVTTKLNEPGPTVTEGDLAALEQRLLSRLQPGDWCVFSGSLPPGAPLDTYARLIRGVHACGAWATLDTSDEAMKLGCQANPDIVKPNAEEAAALVGSPLARRADWSRGIKAILALGPQRVLLSLGSQGAVWADGRSIWWGQPPPIDEVSAVGAGDALLTAALWALMRGLAPAEIIRWAVASGTAAALQEGSAASTLAHVERMTAHVRVECLEQCD